MKTLPFRSILLIASVICLDCITATKSTAQTNDQVVESFFPQAIIDKSVQDHADGGPRPFKVSGYAVGDLNRDGTVFIVAAYSNGFEGTVRVLQKTGNNFGLISESSSRELLGGDFPKVELMDIDSDGRPEVIVSFVSGRGPRGVWVYRWTGAALELISPAETDQYGNRHTLLVEPDFIDLDGDGKLEIVQSTSTGPYPPGEILPIPPVTFEVFKFDGQKYVLLSNDFYQRNFYVRQTGAPIDSSASFNVQSPNSLYSMSIINGAQAGTNRVSSASVKLNGNVIAGPNDFNQKVYVLVFQVPVQAQNTLEVELKGQPGSYITVALRK